MDNDLKNLRDRRTKSQFVMRSIVDYTMGIVYLTGAAFLFFAEKIGFDLQSFDKTFRYIFGSLCAIYGIWRIYRGYKKDYY